MSHKPQELLFATNNGLVAVSGGSTKLAQGVFGIVDKGATNTKDGIPVVNTFPTTPVDRMFELRLGVSPSEATKNRSNKPYASRPFTLREIADISVSAPSLKSSVDEFWIGYDGINADTAIQLENGETAVFDITMSGQGVGFLGYPDGTITTKFYVTAPSEGDVNMAQIIEDAIASYNKTTLVGGVPVSNYVEVTPINSTNVDAEGTAFNLYTLNVPVDGTNANIAQVLAQYPTLDVKVDGSIGGQTTFVVAKTGAAPTAFNVVTTTLTLDCGEYVSSANSTTSISWVLTDTCTAVEKTYRLQLADDECGENKLAEVQARYPELTIAVDGDSERRVTLTGTSGTANVAVGGVNYLATFATDLTTTAANFVTTHAAAISTATGATVTSSGALIVIKDETTGFPTVTITNATGNLAGTVSDIAAVSTNCQTVYTTTVMSDFVCEECSPIIRGLYETEAPAPFDFVNWVAEPTVYDPSALMGIRVKGKKTEFVGDEYMRGSIPFVYDFVRINVAGGYPMVLSENFESRREPYPVKLISIGSRPESLGMDYYDFEDRTRVYMTGEQPRLNNLYRQRVLGLESMLKPMAQYVNYTIEIRPERFAQSFSSMKKEPIRYCIIAEVGKHKQLEALVNSLATAAGLPTVQAYGGN